MTEQDIADYLKITQIFTHHPELLQQLTIPHSHEEGTISLVEAQLAQQREQIKTLTNTSKISSTCSSRSRYLLCSLAFAEKLFQTEDFITINEKLDDWAKGYELEGAKILLSLTAGKKGHHSEQHWLDRKAFELIRLERMGLRQFYLGDLSNKEKPQCSS